MDGNTASIIQMGIFCGMVTVVATVVLGVRAWQRVELAKSEAKRTGDQNALAAVEALRKEFAQLRDTTTRYDLSFDTALQRIEERVAHLETSRLKGPEQAIVESLAVGRIPS